MKFPPLSRLFRFDPEDRITTVAALFCASLLLGLTIRIVWVATHPQTAAVATLTAPGQ